MTKERILEGYAASFAPDLGNDIIGHTAFDDWLREYRSGKVIVPLLDSHDSFSTVRSVLGHMVEAKTDDNGLWAKFSIVPGVDGNELLNRVRHGSLDGLSIGFTIPRNAARKDSDGYRRLSAVEVHEVSVTCFPMNLFARIHRVEGTPTAAATKRIPPPVMRGEHDDEDGYEDDDGSPSPETMALFERLIAACSNSPEDEEY